MTRLVKENIKWLQFEALKLKLINNRSEEQSPKKREKTTVLQIKISTVLQ